MTVAGPAIDQFQQVEAKGAIFWEPLVFSIGLAEAWRIGVGWANPTSDKFNQLRDDYNMGELFVTYHQFDLRLASLRV